MKRDSFTLDLFDASPSIDESITEEIEANEPSDVVLEAVVDGQSLLFDDLPVPELRQAIKIVYVHFASQDDMRAFVEATGLHVDHRTRAIMYPLESNFTR